MDHIRYEYADGLATITLADPDRGNALAPESGDQLFAAVRRAQRDRARVVVLAAEGRFFSVGGDIGSFQAAAEITEHIDDLAEGLHRTISELQRMDAVVVSIVQGPAAGAGFPLAAAADVVVAGESARFSLGYTKIGLSIDGGSSLLVRSLGLHLTLRLALLGDALTAQQAYDAGLVAVVAPDAELADRSAEVVKTLLALPGKAQATAKRVIRGNVNESVESALRNETIGIRTMAGTADGQEGITAFLEKRRPAFEHR